MHDIPQLDAKGLRSFGLTTGGILIALFGLLLPWLFSFVYPVWPWAVAGGLGLWALVAPQTLNPVYRGWMRFGLMMSKITTPLVLGIVYFGVITPTGLIMLLFRPDPMQRAFDNNVDSYKTASREPDKRHFERPF